MEEKLWNMIFHHLKEQVFHSYKYNKYKLYYNI